jgi:hypothetical protein
MVCYLSVTFCWFSYIIQCVIILYCPHSISLLQYSILRGDLHSYLLKNNYVIFILKRILVEYNPLRMSFYALCPLKKSLLSFCLSTFSFLPSDFFYVAKRTSEGYFNSFSLLFFFFFFFFFFFKEDHFPE